MAKHTTALKLVACKKDGLILFLTGRRKMFRKEDITKVLARKMFFLKK